MAATTKMGGGRLGGSYDADRRRVGLSPRPKEAGNGVGQAMPVRTA